MSTTVETQYVEDTCDKQLGLLVQTHPDSIPILDTGNAAVYLDGTNQVQALPQEFYTPLLSETARDRQPNEIHQLLPLESRPGLISLLAGKPNADTFPYTSFNFTARSPTNPSQEVSINIEGKELSKALQYGPTEGEPSLVDWLYGLQEFSHGRKKGEGWQVSIGSGSQDLIYKAVTALVNPGDAVLVESPVYAGVIPMFKNLNCEQIEVETDSNGISAESLHNILEGWPSMKAKPRILYTVPYGCNPTGMTATLERRKEVLVLARKHNFIILEDDPYYYLYYGKAAKPPSYFSLELEEPEVGRVLRFDSLSKILSAGLRIGFASGPSALLQAMNQHTSYANLQPNSLGQVIAFKLLQSWGYDGFLMHTRKVSQFYEEKRDIFESAMERHLDGLAEWSTPEAGMFVWFKLLLNDTDGEADSESLIKAKAFERGVLALPGTVFLPNGRKTSYVRAAFSLTAEHDVEEAMRRLREVILEARACSM